MGNFEGDIPEFYSRGRIAVCGFYLSTLEKTNYRKVVCLGPAVIIQAAVRFLHGIIFHSDKVSGIF